MASRKDKQSVYGVAEEKLRDAEVDLCESKLLLTQNPIWSAKALSRAVDTLAEIEMHIEYIDA